MWPYDDEDDEQGAVAQDESDVKSESPASSGNDGGLGGNVPDSSQPSVRDQLLAKYAAASDPTALKDAQQNGKYGHMALALGQAAENFARAPIVARGGAGANPAAYNAMGHAIDSHVGQVAQQRQGAMDEVLKQHTLGKQLDQEDIARQENDSASPKSLAIRAYMKSMYPGMPVPDSLSYAEVQKSMAPMAAKFQADQTKRDIAQQRLDAIKERQAALAENRRQFDASRADRAKETTDAKTAKQQADALRDLYKDAESPRGNPAVQQAQKALVNIKNAKELLAPYEGNYDQMPDDQVKLLNAEIAKIASGGVASEHGQKDLNANTFNQRWQKFKAEVGNSPEPAQLGAFIRNNKRYLDGLEQSNKGVYHDYVRKIHSGNAGRVGDEGSRKFKEDYADAFQEAKAPEKVAPPAGGDGMALGAPATPPVDALEAEMKRRGLKPKTGISGGW